VNDRLRGTLRAVDLHPATTGFDRAADVYDRARPEYPDPVVDRLVAELGVGAGATVVDIGAGTGKLTRPLLARGLRVIAVEPVAGMRATLAATTPGADVRDGTAERLPLGDATADAITVAQAFHWFATAEALTEFRRVLRPGARLAIVWNTRDLSQPLHRALHETLAPYRTDEPRHYHGDWAAVFGENAPFRLVAHVEHPHVQELSREGLVERALSTSFIAALPDAERDAVAGRVRALAPAEPVGLAYTSEVFVYEPA
jgi:SAM-dependent methyltransferase